MRQEAHMVRNGGIGRVKDTNEDGSLGLISL